MAIFNKDTKSNRILQSKRYTIAQFDVAEAYTKVLDINSSEIYIQQNAIPTGSLPYSGSSQNGLYIANSKGENILRYYHRLRLTPSDVLEGGKPNTFFTISGSDGTAIGNQIINSNQLTDWVSNKYLNPANAAKKSEDNPPGYNIMVFNGSSLVSGNDYQFDYKTGIIQFISTTVSPSNSDSLFLSGYQYVGKTLDSFIEIGGQPGGPSNSIQFNNNDESFEGDSKFLFNPLSGLTQLSGSFQITGSTGDLFLIKSGSFNILRMSSSGALVFGDLHHTPPPVEGGLFYSSSNFYVGVE